MRLWILGFVGVWVLYNLLLAAGPATAEEATGERLLLGFEEDEIKNIGQALGKRLQKLTPVEGGFDVEARYVFQSSPQVGTWQIRSARSSQGKYALQLAGGSPLNTHISQQYPHMPYGDKEQPAAQAPYYRGMEGCKTYRALVTCSIFRRIFPTDWSGYDLLRFDVLSEEAAHTFQVVLEDEVIEPPVVRNVRSEPGKWMTVEVDLRGAASSRGLDLTRMATLYVIITEGGKTKAWLDNLRLCRKGTPPTFRTARDDSPQELPAYYRSSSSPEPETLPEAKPDRSPIQLGEPSLIEGPGLDNAAVTDQSYWFVKKGVYYLALTPCGWAAAYDNKHLLVGFTGYGERNVFALQSLDGGKTWRGLDGGERATAVPVPNPNHGAGRGDVVGRRADVIILTNLGCAGVGNAAMRLYTQTLTFTGKGWELRKDPVLLDCDLRHCSSSQSVLRLSNGRLWCAYGLVGRLGNLGINARYSDDDGLVWKSWREGQSGALPGSFPSGLGTPGGCSTYTFEEPCLVPYGENGIACFWYWVSGSEEVYDSTDILRWARFDGKTWSPIETIDLGKSVRGERAHLRPSVHAVSLAGKEIFLASKYFKGILHYDGSGWKKECPEIPAGSRISAAGDKAVIVFAIVDEEKAINCWRRLPGGKWAGPLQLAKEETPIFMEKGFQRGRRPGLVVQAYAPPNFVPIAWTCKDKRWIKFLRVPVGEDKE